MIALNLPKSKWISLSYVPLLLVLGTTTLWPIADGMLFWYFYRNRNVKFTWFTVALLIIGLANGALNLHLFPVLWAIRIVLVYSLMHDYRLPNSLVPHFVFAGVIGTQIILMSVQMILGEPRPYGISLNALLSADMAFAFLVSPNWLGAGAVLALSGSRTVMLAAVVLAIFGRSVPLWISVLTASVLFTIVVINVSPERITFEGLIADSEKRIETLDSGEQIDDSCGELRTPKITPTGYGVGLYCDATGRQGPHNVFVMSAYSLGLLVIPFWFIIFMRFSRKFYYFIPALIVIAMFTDDLFTRPEGVYVLALLIAHYRMYFGTRDFRYSHVQWMSERGRSPQQNGVRSDGYEKQG